MPIRVKPIQNLISLSRQALLLAGAMGASLIVQTFWVHPAYSEGSKTGRATRVDAAELKAIMAEAKACGKDARKFAQRMELHAAAGKQAYAGAFREMSDRVSSVVERQCAAAAGGALAERIACFRDTLGVMEEDARIVIRGALEDAGPKGFAIRFMNQLKKDDSFIGPVLAEQCGKAPTDDCFTRNLKALGQQLIDAYNGMSDSYDELNRWGVLGVECGKAAGIAPCRAARAWTPTDFVPAQAPSYAPRVAFPGRTGTAETEAAPQGAAGTGLVAKNDTADAKKAAAEARKAEAAAKRAEAATARKAAVALKKAEAAAKKVEAAAKKIASGAKAAPVVGTAPAAWTAPASGAAPKDPVAPTTPPAEPVQAPVASTPPAAPVPAPEAPSVPPAETEAPHPPMVAAGNAPEPAAAPGPAPSSEPPSAPSETPSPAAAPDSRGGLGGAGKSEGEQLDCSPEALLRYRSLGRSRVGMGNFARVIPAQGMAYACMVRESYSSNPHAVFLARIALRSVRIVGNATSAAVKDEELDGIEQDARSLQEASPVPELAELIQDIPVLRSQDNSALVISFFSGAPETAKTMSDICAYKRRVEASEPGSTLGFFRELCAM